MPLSILTFPIIGLQYGLNDLCPLCVSMKDIRSYLYGNVFEAVLVIYVTADILR